MALTAMSVCGQPSVLYFLRSQPSSRYQPVSFSSAIFAAISASEYVRSFGFAMMHLQKGCLVASARAPLRGFRVAANRLPRDGSKQSHRVAPEANEEHAVEVAG